MKSASFAGMLLIASLGASTLWARGASALSSSPSTVPYPVQVDGNGNVVVGPNGPTPFWDGSLVDLMAADAWAQCAASVTSDAKNPQDPYQGYLASKMQDAVCNQAETSSTNQSFTVACDPASTLCPAVQQWALQRMTPGCNIDASTGQPSTVTFFPNELGTAPLPTTLPDPSTFTDVNSQTPALLSGAVAKSQLEVDIADVNLCMAQRLTEYQASADSLFLQGDDLRELLEVTRERAQIAAIWYALLGRAFTNPDDRPGNSIVNDQQIFPILLSLAKNGDGFPFSLEGSRFTAAVQLLIQSTNQLADVIRRSASAHIARGGSPQSDAQIDWGPGSWRQRLLALLYGPNPLSAGDSENETDLGNPNVMNPTVVDAQGTVPWDTNWTNSPLPNVQWPNALIPVEEALPYAQTPVTSPQATELLGLARQADALLFKEADTSFTVPSVSCSDGPLVYNFHRIDVASSAPELYTLVEAYLRTQDCIAAGNASCAVLPNDPSIPPISSYESWDLWQRYGISPDDAQTLAQLLSEQFEQFQFPNNISVASQSDLDLLYEFAPGGCASIPLQEVEGASHFTGSHSTLTGTALAARIPGASGTWWHVDPSYLFEPYVTQDRAPLFSRSVPYWIPRSFDEWNLGVDEGFDPSGVAPQNMGSVSSLVAIRELVEHSISDAASSATLSGMLTSYFGQSTQILNGINGAIGSRSFSAKPVTQYEQLPESCQDWNDGSNTNVSSCYEPVQQASADGSTASWQFTVRTTSDDPFFSGSAVTLVIVPASGLEVEAALDPNFQSVGGQTRANLLASSAAVEVGQTSQTTLGSNIVERTYVANVRTISSVLGTSPPSFYGAIVGNGFVPTRTPYSVFLKTTNSAGAVQYQVLAQRLGLTVSGMGFPLGGSSLTNVFIPVDGQYIGFGGSFGNTLTRAWATIPYDASKPAYDGFDVPTDWVPPSDPSLFGGTAGTDATSFYLSSASSSATDATNAVQSAVMELLSEETDQANAQAARTKAAQINALDVLGLCGSANTSCDTTMTTVTWNSGITCPTSSGPGTDICNALTKAIQAALPQTITIANAVGPHINDTSAPAFSDYSGGTLQSLLIAQWQALNHIILLFNEASAGVNDQENSISAAQAELTLSTPSKQFGACSSAAFQNAWTAGFSFGYQQGSDLFGSTGFPFTTLGYSPPDNDANNLSQVNSYDTYGWTPGPFEQQWNECNDEQAGLPAEQAKDALTIADAWNWVATQQAALADAGTACQQANANISKALQDATFSQVQADIDSAVAQAGLTTSFGTFIRYNSYDVWRAQALLDSARRYASAARHAIEGQYVVDLSSLNGDEPFVAAPATWANDVYQYDLSPPSAVGLMQAPAMATSMTGGQTMNNIYPNQVTDYVNNLQGFVQGYAINRPTAVAQQDDELLSLPGPDAQLSTSSGTAGGIDGNDAMWTFQCAGATNWVTNPELQSGATTTLGTMCSGGPPALASLRFFLDPWGRLQGSVANPPYVRRENVRWTELAVNLVGTGIRNCAIAVDQNECFSDSFVRYDLEHAGPAWITDYTEQWHALGQPEGFIEGAKALAAEQWLDPVGNGFNESYVSAVARTEFQERALGGDYRLELQLPTDVQMSNIEQVQILTRTSYWVRQQ
jgi:hypothetical protein